MKIIVLTAGLGTRLRPHTLTRPKALLNVAGKPVLSYVIDQLLKLSQIESKLEFIFVNGYLGTQIEEYVQQEYVQTGKLKAHFVEQLQPLGQAHAIGLTRDVVLADTDDCDVLVVFADTLFEVDFTVLTQLPAAVVGALFLQQVADPRRFGVAVLDEKSGYIKQVVEKPTEPISNLAICSPYYFKSARQLFATIEQLIHSGKQTKGEFFLADAISQMLESGLHLQPLALPVWLDAGTFEALLETNQALLDTSPAVAPINASSVLLPPVWIDRDVIIERSVVGPHVAVSKGAVIRDSVVSDSILEEGSQLSRASVQHSIIGRFAKVTGPFSASSISVGDYTEV